MDKRGVPFGVAVAADKGEQKLVDLISKGRIEQMLRKKFVLSRDEYELKLRCKSEEMADINLEIKMLDSDGEEAKKNLKRQWCDMKEEKKKKIYNSWAKFTEDKKARRNGVEIE